VAHEFTLCCQSSAFKTPWNDAQHVGFAEIDALLVSWWLAPACLWPGAWSMTVVRPSSS
jgi:hypothetical protein